MGVFEDALTAMLADTSMAVEATWRAGGAEPGVVLRAARYRPAAAAEFNGGLAIGDGEQIEVAQAAAPGLAEGDTFEIDGVVWQVRGTPERRGEGLTWLASVFEV